ncbi:MAG: tRNA uridine-5-carboxymethylaminomethyl(34) synthesis enzyme MnmG [Chitinivibrionales bacterium]|nr:tRNA uridine-5-carboxymethylaminomethyl(34) synthesis enzyme MnmG [Chitinivibrionales bacterium]
MQFDVVVIGGGHAGIEAAWIAAQKKLAVLLVTNHIDLIGQMSCNPAIGGIAKGNIVREIDALGGLMGRAIDAFGIHFKMLNSSKGAAVWGNRAQADKQRYRNGIQKMLMAQKRICFLQGMVVALNTKGESIYSIIMDSGVEVRAKTVVLAMGTFLNGLCHIGLSSFAGGRCGEPPSCGLTKSIAELGIKSGRLKTGTPPRIDGRTVNFSKMQAQEGDAEPWPFSFATEHKLKNRAVCWITKTNSTTHAIIRDNLDRSPLYSGKIKSSGPKYCPSIEDKVIRFGDRGGHTLFLEPEGLDTSEMYLNGLSTSLPFDVQEKLVNSIAGLERAKIVRPGYAIEYDFFQPLQLKPTLESKKVKNLFFAGQINGTSGYEEAAGQGVLAGINAAQNALGEEGLMLSRDEAYIGVLIDDLTTKGTEEPYRMFTSRAEHRLLLRQDNCDERLLPKAYNKGYISRAFYQKRRKVWEKEKRELSHLAKTNIKPKAWNNSGPGSIKIPTRSSVLLKRPEVTIGRIYRAIKRKLPNRETCLRIEANIKYEGFIEIERAEYDKLKKLENQAIPFGFDFNEVAGLLNETKKKFLANKPATLKAALSIPGVTPADISVLMIHIAKEQKFKNVSRETVGL